MLASRRACSQQTHAHGGKQAAVAAVRPVATGCRGAARLIQHQNLTATAALWGAIADCSARPVVVCSAAATGDLAAVPSTADGKLISRTEVPAFIQRDDMMDQMFQWAVIEAGEGGVRNFGLPMSVEPFYNTVEGESMLWGYKVGLYKEGVHLCDLGIMFDLNDTSKYEWVGRGQDGFPVLEGRVDAVAGKNLEIW